MTRDPKLARMAAMADMVLDAKSSALRTAAERRLALLAQLEALQAASAADAQDLVAARAAYAFEQWAAVRRGEINLLLASAQADWLSHLDDTRRAFGRTQVLARMQERAASRRRD